MDRDLIDYFISKTDERFDKIEAKVDQVLKFKWQINGGTIVASAVITILLNLALFIFKK